MAPFFKELFNYNHHCNQALIDAMAPHHDRLSEKCINLFSHMLDAHHVWNCRIARQQPLYGVWVVHRPEDFNRLNLNNHNDTLQILEQADLNKMIAYTNSRGDAYSNSARDILFHVINHFTYHRGQIATEFRQMGLEPVPTDYIFYKWTRG